MEGFGIDLKTFLHLAMPTNALKLLESKYQAGFGVIIWGQNPLTFMIPGSAKTSLIAHDRKFNFFTTNTKTRQYTIEFHCQNEVALVP